MKVVLQGHILVPGAELETVRGALEEHVRLTRLEKGCLCFEVTPDARVPNRFNVHEEFVDREAFERHQQRVRSSAWADITKNVSRHYRVEGLE